jgi:AraC-like DNA-binding protein
MGTLKTDRRLKPESDGSSRAPDLIVVARPEVANIVRQSLPAWLLVEIRNPAELTFATSLLCEGDKTIALDVYTALHELQLLPVIAHLPRELQQVLRALAGKTVTPQLSEIIPEGMSERKFQRLWERNIAEPPARFLARVRRSHAMRLEKDGLSLKEAACRAGYSSPARWREARRRRG